MLTATLAALFSIAADCGSRAIDEREQGLIEVERRFNRRLAACTTARAIKAKEACEWRVGRKLFP